MVVMLAELLPTEMAFGRRIAEHKVRGREETIDEHPVQLLAFEVEEDRRGSWRRVLVRKHLALLAALRLKPDRRLLPRRDWHAWLRSRATRRATPRR